MQEITRENAARKALRPLELRLVKTPARHWTRAEYGVGYMVMQGNTVLIGASQREYDATLEDVENYLNARTKKPSIPA